MALYLTVYGLHVLSVLKTCIEANVVSSAADVKTNLTSFYLAKESISFQMWAENDYWLKFVLCVFVFVREVEEIMIIVIIIITIGH